MEWKGSYWASLQTTYDKIFWKNPGILGSNLDGWNRIKKLESCLRNSHTTLKKRCRPKLLILIDYDALAWIKFWIEDRQECFDRWRFTQFHSPLEWLLQLPQFLYQSLGLGVLGRNGKNWATSQLWFLISSLRVFHLSSLHLVPLSFSEPTNNMNSTRALLEAYKLPQVEELRLVQSQLILQKLLRLASKCSIAHGKYQNDPWCKSVKSEFSFCLLLVIMFWAWHTQDEIYRGFESKITLFGLTLRIMVWTLCQDTKRIPPIMDLLFLMLGTAMRNKSHSDID